MKERLFKFKNFSVHHSVSAMKVGVDGVLIGAWANVSNCLNIIDIGSGCGLISLMCAQRNNIANIYAVELDAGAYEESRRNFKLSPWGDRIKVIHDDATRINVSDIDCIVSNPPFFAAGKNQLVSSRELARHCGGLNPFSVIEIGNTICSNNAIISMILPFEYLNEITSFSKSQEWKLNRICRVKGHPSAPIKRIMVELGRGDKKFSETIEEELTLHTSKGEPTDQYRQLCKEFYLKF